MKGWVGLVGWPVADGLPTLVVTHQLQVERRTGKVRQSETDVLPLCHATNCIRRQAKRSCKQCALPALSWPPHVIAVLSVGTWGNVAASRAPAVVCQCPRFDSHQWRRWILHSVQWKQRPSIANVLDARCNKVIKRHSVVLRARTHARTHTHTHTHTGTLVAMLPYRGRSDKKQCKFVHIYLIKNCIWFMCADECTVSKPRSSQ